MRIKGGVFLGTITKGDCQGDVLGITIPLSIHSCSFFLTCSANTGLTKPVLEATGGP